MGVLAAERQVSRAPIKVIYFFKPQGAIVYHPSQDSRNMAALMFVLSIFFWIIPALVMYLVKRDDAFIFDNAVELLNFGLTLFIANMILMFIPVLGWLAMLGIGIAALVFLILGALRVREGEIYIFPFALRLIRQA